MRPGELHPLNTLIRAACVVRRFRGDTRGTTAVEFALVATPFFLLMMGIMTVGMQYLALHSLEHAVGEASRQIRTGQAQKAGMTVDDFRKMVCDEAGSTIACDSRLVVHFRSAERFRDLVPMPSCIVDDGLAPPSGAGDDSLVTAVGEEDRKVVVNICYDWVMGMQLWQSIWGLISPTPTTGSGKIILSAATVFQTEPYK
ncbi:pilus biosynthesis protein TadE [Hyphomicrobium nitrativorans NL23]|uniref:Pilus biosynthesis protein TadE n=1 Tax=Hyphomicrobium nitrativorans NL23 TaxID=1029756 RepID=V5SEI1_9HYPH|nr:pilus biosynthesis protein TadE [Hyphomicrobium nitrativorans NL23]